MSQTTRRQKQKRKRAGGAGDLSSLVLNTLLSGLTLSQPRRGRIFNKRRTHRKKSYKRVPYYQNY